jgi:6-phosphogluconolactonase
VRAAQAAAGALLAELCPSLPVVPAAAGPAESAGGASPPPPALLPAFDLVVLGLGADGHVAGLFPNDAAALASPPAGPWVLPVPDPSPTPPHVPRWTLSLPVLNAAGRAIVTATGTAKAAAVARSVQVQALPGAAPAQLLRPAGGVAWMVDADAGADLSPGAWGEAKRWQRSAVGGPKE